MTPEDKDAALAAMTARAEAAEWELLEARRRGTLNWSLAMEEQTGRLAAVDALAAMTAERDALRGIVQALWPHAYTTRLDGTCYCKCCGVDAAPGLEPLTDHDEGCPVLAAYRVVAAMRRAAPTTQAEEPTK